MGRRRLDRWATGAVPRLPRTVLLKELPGGGGERVTTATKLATLFRKRRKETVLFNIKKKKDLMEEEV